MAKLKIQQIKSDYFTLEEFINSATAQRLKIDNTPTADIIRNLQYGVDMVLEPLRRLQSKPIKITSGYRCPRLNKAVGGVNNSWHLRGCAADVHVENEDDAKEKFAILKKLPSVDTALFEHSTTGQWLHVQWDMARTPRKHFNYNFQAS